MSQGRFDFVGDLDDQFHKTIEAMPALAWIARCYHATAEAAIADAQRAAPLTGPLYVVEHPVPVGFRGCWPYPTLWQVTNAKPFYGQTVGNTYYPRPAHYVVDVGTAAFFPAEDPEIVKLKQKEATEKWKKGR